MDENVLNAPLRTDTGSSLRTSTMGDVWWKGEETSPYAWWDTSPTIEAPFDYATGTKQAIDEYVNASIRLQSIGLDPDTLDGRSKEPFWAKGIKTLTGLGVASDWLFGDALVRMVLGGLTGLLKGEGLEWAVMQGDEVDRYAEQEDYDQLFETQRLLGILPADWHPPTGKELLLMWGMDQSEDKKGKIDLVDGLGLLLEIGLSPEAWLGFGWAPATEAAVRGGNHAIRAASSDILHQLGGQIADAFSRYGDDAAETIARNFGYQPNEIKNLLRRATAPVSLTEVGTADTISIVDHVAAIERMDSMGLLANLMGDTSLMRHELDVAKAGLLPNVNELVEMGGGFAESMQRSDVKRLIKELEEVTSASYAANDAYKELTLRAAKEMGDLGGIKIGLPGWQFSRTGRGSVSLVTQKQVDDFLAKHNISTTFAEHWKRSTLGRAITRTFVPDWRLKTLRQYDEGLANSLISIKRIAESKADHELHEGINGLVASMQRLSGKQGRIDLLRLMEHPGEINAWVMQVLDDSGVTAFRNMVKEATQPLNGLDQVVEAHPGIAKLHKTIDRFFPQEVSEAIKRAADGAMRSDGARAAVNVGQTYDELVSLIEPYRRKAVAQRMYDNGVLPQPKVPTKFTTDEAGQKVANPLRRLFDAEIAKSGDLGEDAIEEFLASAKYDDLTKFNEIMGKFLDSHAEFSTYRATGYSFQGLTQENARDAAKRLDQMMRTAKGMPVEARAELIESLISEIGFLQKHYDDALSATEETFRKAFGIAPDQDIDEFIRNMDVTEYAALTAGRRTEAIPEEAIGGAEQYARMTVAMQDAGSELQRIRKRIDQDVFDLWSLVDMPVEDKALAQSVLKDRLYHYSKALKANIPQYLRPIAEDPEGYRLMGPAMRAIDIDRLASTETLSYYLSRNSAFDDAEILYGPDVAAQLRKEIDDNPQMLLDAEHDMAWRGKSQIKDTYLYITDDPRRVHDVGIITGSTEGLGIPAIRLVRDGLGPDDQAVRVAVNVNKVAVVEPDDFARLTGKPDETIRIVMPNGRKKEMRVDELIANGYDAVFVRSSQPTAARREPHQLFVLTDADSYTQATRTAVDAVPDDPQAISRRPILVSWTEDDGTVTSRAIAGEDAANIRKLELTGQSDSETQIRTLLNLPDDLEITIDDMTGYVPGVRILDFDPNKPVRYGSALDLISKQLDMDPDFLMREAYDQVDQIPGEQLERWRSRGQLYEPTPPRESAPSPSSTFDEGVKAIKADPESSKVRFKDMTIVRDADVDDFYTKFKHTYGDQWLNREQIDNMHVYYDKQHGLGIGVYEAKKHVPGKRGGKGRYVLTAPINESGIEGAAVHALIQAANPYVKMGADVAVNLPHAADEFTDFLQALGFEVSETTDLATTFILNPKKWDDFLKRNPKALTHGVIEDLVDGKGIDYIRYSVPLPEPGSPGADEIRNAIQLELTLRESDQQMLQAIESARFDNLPKEFAEQAGLPEWNTLSQKVQDAAQALFAGADTTDVMRNLTIEEADAARQWADAVRNISDELEFQPRPTVTAGNYGFAETGEIVTGIQEDVEYVKGVNVLGESFLKSDQRFKKMERIAYEFLPKDIPEEQRRTMATLTAYANHYLDEMRSPKRNIAPEELDEWFHANRVYGQMKVGDHEFIVGPGIAQEAVDELNRRLGEPGAWVSMAKRYGLTIDVDDPKSLAAFSKKLFDTSVWIYENWEQFDGLRGAMRVTALQTEIGRKLGIPERLWHTIRPDELLLPAYEYMPHIASDASDIPVFRRMLGAYEEAVPENVSPRMFARPVSTKMENVQMRRELQGTIEAVNRLVGRQLFTEDPAKAMAVYIKRAVRAINNYDMIESLLFTRDSYGKRVIAPAIYDAATKEWKAPKGYKIFTMRDIEKVGGDINKMKQLFWDRADEVEALMREHGRVRLMAREEIVDEFERHSRRFFGDEQFDEYARVFEQVQGIWKTYATVVRPGFHIRNALSNLWQNLYAGVKNPRHYSEAMDLQIAAKKAEAYMLEAALGDAEHAPRIITDINQAYIELVEQGVLKAKHLRFGDADLSYGYVMSLMKENGILGTGRIGSDIHVFTEQRLKELSPTQRYANPLSQAYFLTTAGRNFGELVENNARAAHFIAMMEATGGDASAAAWSVRKYLFDYNELTDTERNILRNIFPFYAWMRKNAQLIADMLIHRPFQITAAIRTQTRLTNIDTTEYKPEWVDETGGFALPGLTVGGLNKLVNAATGNVLNLDETAEQPLYVALGLPYLDLLEYNGRDLLSSMTPLIRAPIEMVTNYNAFFDEPIEKFDGQLVKAPNEFVGLDDFVMSYGSETTKQAWNDMLSKWGVRRNEMTGDVMTGPWFKYVWTQAQPHLGAYGKAIPSDDPDWMIDAINFWTGIRFIPIDEESAAYYEWKEKSEAAEEAILAAKQQGIDVPTVTELREQSEGGNLRESTQGDVWWQ